MKWIAKAVIQKTISFLPDSRKINYLFQKHITKGVLLTDAYLHDKLVHCHNHLLQFNKHSAHASGFVAVEIGTGWYPVIPIGFFLSGADKVVTLDISLLMKKENLQSLLRKLLGYYQDDKLQDFIPGIKAERIQVLEKIFSDEKLSMEEMLERMNISYAVQDARYLSLPGDYADLITSNNTFEHIYPDVLKEILEEFKRIAKAEAVMSHFIDMSDHFAHFDSNITIYNFLKFSEKQWKLIDNDLQPQNRWRLSQYRQLYKEMGIPITEEINRAGNPDQVAGMKLAAPFNKMDIRDVSVSHSLLVSKMG